MSTLTKALEKETSTLMPNKRSKSPASLNLRLRSPSLRPFASYTWKVIPASTPERRRKLPKFQMKM